MKIYKMIIIIIIIIIIIRLSCGHVSRPWLTLTLSDSGDAERRLEADRFASTALSEFLNSAAAAGQAGEYDCERFDIPATMTECPPTSGLRLRVTVGDVDIAPAGHAGPAADVAVERGEVRVSGDG